MARAGIQLYSLRDVELPFDELLSRVATAGFEGVEFAYRVRDEDADAVASALADEDLAAAGAHVPIGDLEDDFADTVAFYDTIDCREIVIPSLPGECFQSQDAIEQVADRVDELAAKLAAHDMRLHYHNHLQEFVDLEGTSGFHRFIDATEIGIEVDVGFIVQTDYDPVELIESLGDRAVLVHLKDTAPDTGESVPLGEGAVDVEGVLGACEAGPTEWVFYEYEMDDPLATLSDAATIMRG